MTHAKFPVLAPLAGKMSSFIKDSRDFTNKVRELVLVPGEVMTSYDVKSLFTCIPPQGADDSLQERTQLSVRISVTYSTFV